MFEYAESLSQKTKLEKLGHPENLDKAPDGANLDSPKLNEDEISGLKILLENAMTNNKKGCETKTENAGKDIDGIDAGRPKRDTENDIRAWAAEDIAAYEEKTGQNGAFKTQPRDTYYVESGTDVQDAQVLNAMYDVICKEGSGRSPNDFYQVADSGNDFQMKIIPAGETVVKTHGDYTPNPDSMYYATEKNLKDDGILKDGKIDADMAQEKLSLPSGNSADRLSQRTAKETIVVFESSVAPSSEMSEDGAIKKHDGGGTQTIIPDTYKLSDYTPL
jgi:hypothetical protein